MPSNRRYDYDRGPVRRCTQCQEWLPETSENFAYNTTRGTYNSWCKPCVRSYNQRVRAGGPRTTAGEAASAFDRSFGVEIEFIGSAVTVARELRNRGLEVASVGTYTHTVSHTAWKIVPDGSVHAGAELVSPILTGDAGREQVRLASEALQAAGATVNQTTGLHVHHDSRNLTVSAIRQLVRNWAACQTATDGLVARSRRTNFYCAPFEDSELQLLLGRLGAGRRRATQSGMRVALSGLTRYKALNLQSYPRYGTIEVRQHQGTTDADKILAWVEFGQAMIAAAVAGTTLDTSDTEALLTALPLHEETRTYLTARATKFARQLARA